MVQLIESGEYRLIETRNQTKILILNNKRTFAWVNVEEIGEILVTSHKTHATDNILAIGKYRLYMVKDEPNLTDLEHLELLVGDGVWQGYLLPTGLPSDIKTRNRVVPTQEVISKTN